MSNRTLPVLLLAFLVGCSARQSGGERPQIDLLAVLPIELAAPKQPDEGEEKPLPADAGLAVTAQIYRFLAAQSEFRFVADLTIQDAVQAPSVRDAPDLKARAVALGKDVSADAVIFGTVSRFDERVGTEWGATSPASVSFDLRVVYVASGEVLWEGGFDRTQAPPRSNLLTFWMFWRDGPHWLSARELTAQGMEKLLKGMTDVIEP